jgi:ferredoxin
MKVVVDRDLCEANRICMRLLPEVFQISDSDQLILCTDRIAPELRARVELAVRRCPRQALQLVKEKENEKDGPAEEA